MVQSHHKKMEAGGGSSKKSVYESRVKQEYRLPGDKVNKIRLVYDYVERVRKENSLFDIGSMTDAVSKQVEDLRRKELTGSEARSLKKELEKIYEDMKHYLFPI
jgi:hypothetical protein